MRLVLATAVLAGTLSWSLAEPPRTALPEVAAPAPTRLGPTDADWLENHLGRFQMRISPAERRLVAETLVAESERYGLDLELLLAVIRIESCFNSFARSHKGALGLMQVMPRTGERVARDIGVEWRGPDTLFDPVANVRIGTAYLASLYARYDDMDRALAAYNWGPGSIDRRLSNGRPVPERYVTQVMTALESRARP